MTRHLLVSISAHGFGHAVQAAVVVNALWERWPDLQVTLQTALSGTVLAGFFLRDFELIERGDDVGMLMASPLKVLAEETADAYEALHAGWETRVEAEAAALAARLLRRPATGSVCSTCAVATGVKGKQGF